MLKGTYTCEMRRVESSNIRRVGYIEDHHILFVDFGSSLYQYLNVKPDTYKDFMQAESKGSFFSQVIKADPEVVCIKIPMKQELDII